jgi:hypothetical protein
MESHSNEPTINELLELLDKKTTSALAKRLHQIVDGAPLDKAQLIFEFIEEGITAHEEESFPESQIRYVMVAEEVLERIEK